LTTLNKEQIDALEDMIQRRVENTGESRKEACEYIKNYLINGFPFGT
jgi:hypothetical protein